MDQTGKCPFCKSEDVSLIQYAQSFRACKPCLILANMAVVREINYYRDLSNFSVQHLLKKNLSHPFNLRKITIRQAKGA